MYEEKIADLMKKIGHENAQNSGAEEEIERMKKQVADFQLLLEVDYYLLLNEYFFFCYIFSAFLET